MVNIKQPLLFFFFLVMVMFWFPILFVVEIGFTALFTPSGNPRDLANECVYDVRVRAVNSAGMSDFSQVFNFYVKTARKSHV